ncbi:MAG: aminotransferase class I/II-fold pyridoxal phosphate-dependent enzyme [Candidatus Omnitrophica bacterium]|nr:aminotransferase class I/II-fold pyridoxal phosphate-dependent enzyme [Candidatus Omnitrophota bacterium]
MELDAPNVGEIEKQRLQKVIESSFISTYGPQVGEFENQMAAFLGANYAAAVQSGTAAIHMALHELGIGPGDEVIVPVLTFVATVNPVKYVGATPVFVDVDPSAWTMDPRKVEAAITPRTKAIIVVHLYGNPGALPELRAAAKKYRLAVIEDATESLGATYQGQHTGTWGDFGCLSFNGNKTITTGGGGMIIGQAEDRIKHIRFLVNQGRDEQRGYFHPEMGFNYRMTNLEAALGLAQMERLPYFLQVKERFHAIYTAELGNCCRIHFQQELPQAKSSWWFNCVGLDPDCDISALQKSLKDRGIPTRRFFMPLVEFPMYQGTGNNRELYPNAYAIYEKGLCLPSSTINSEEDIRAVCRALRECA